ncbi:hypothetical protein LTS10_010075 [Elasticomyces elasticus]|nr:hypothetical protein LTS10_010075 [Elasticomyces elasticus]
MASTLWPGESKPSNLNHVLDLSDSDPDSSNSPGTDDNSDTDSEPEVDPAGQELNTPNFRLLDLPPELWLRIIQTAIQLPSPETLAQYYRLNDFEIVEETFNSGNLISEIGMQNLRNMREVNYRAVCRASYYLRKWQFEALDGVEVEVKEAVEGSMGRDFKGVYRFVAKFGVSVSV